MAKLNVRLRPNTQEENHKILLEIRARREIDLRKQDELNDLFESINTDCATRILNEKKKASTTIGSTSADISKQEKPLHYGPLPGFPPGKWWGIRIDCSRDSVHEPFNESVHSGPFGAISICTSHLNPHNDVDLGDLLTFTHRDCSALDQIKDPLILNFKNRVPVRLVRSYCLSNSFAPKTGYRYDGLYTVVEHWIGVSYDTTKHRKFALIRVQNQESPPWIDKALKKSVKVVTPRKTRSHSNNTNSQELKVLKLTHEEVQKETKTTSAIVSKQIFNKFIPGSPNSSPKSISSTDSTSQNSGCTLYSCPITTKICNTNLSVRTNLYDSSQKMQDVRKTTVSFCSRLYKSNNQTVQIVRKNSNEEFEKSSTSDAETLNESPSLSTSAVNNSTQDKKVKKVTWADSSDSPLISVQKSSVTTGNGFEYIGSDIVHGFSPTSSKKATPLKHNSMLRDGYSNGTLEKSSSIQNSSTNSPQKHIVQVHSMPNAVVAQTYSTMHESQSPSLHETERLKETSLSSSIDSLAPDKLVNVIFKEKYHPMAKLLIGNMIGLENQESAILSAYNALTSKVDQDALKKSKENKLRNRKFFMRDNSEKNGIMKKQRREIANLIIDAKFEPIVRCSRNRGRLRTSNTKLKSDFEILKKRISKSNASQHKLVNTRRLQQSRNLKKEIRSKAREQLKPKKSEKRKVEETVPIVKQPKLVSRWTQCTLLAAPTVDECLQAGTSFVETSVVEEDELKFECVDLDEIKLEPCEDQEEPDTSCAERSFSSYTSAFAAVNTVGSSLARIARLRSIGFRPISGTSPMEDDDSNENSTRPEVEEYNKYTSEENEVVGYMDEQLHFEDIEDEDMDIAEDSRDSEKTEEEKLLPRPIETLTEKDFDKPWHGWKKMNVDGRTYWAGY